MQNCPIFLFILTDDQAPQTLSCYGNQVLETPNIDQLAKSGIVLDRAYHMGSMSGAVCSPSRTMIMTGRTLWHLPPRGKKHFKDEVGEVTGSHILKNSLPAVFNRAGYETFRTCKKGNSYSLANELFQVVKDKTARKLVLTMGVNGMGFSYSNFWRHALKRRIAPPFLLFWVFTSS